MEQPVSVMRRLELSIRQCPMDRVHTVAFSGIRRVAFRARRDRRLQRALRMSAAGQVIRSGDLLDLLDRGWLNERRAGDHALVGAIVGLSSCICIGRKDELWHMNALETFGGIAEVRAEVDFALRNPLVWSLYSRGGVGADVISVVQVEYGNAKLQDAAHQRLRASDAESMAAMLDRACK